MNGIMNVGLSINSREISEMVEKRHDNVKRTIETLIGQGVITHPQIEEVEDKQSLSPNNKTKSYVFTGEQGKRDSIVVVAQLSPQFTARLVDRWQELERHFVQPTPPALPTPAYLAQSVVESMMSLAKQFEVPMSFAMQLASSEATRISGLSFDKLLTQSSCMNNVSDAAVYLEPTELGKHFGLSAAQFNKVLAQAGLQVKTMDGWVPTEEGSQFCQRHAWSRAGKSGYNLKWLCTAMEELLEG